MADNLKEKAAKGIIWRVIGNGGTQVIQFISGIYIARILSPDDYGLIGMMAVFIAISRVFIDSGFRATLIQRGENITYDHYNVVFIFNVLVSCLFYFIIFFGAYGIADFYNEPRLVLIARILSLNLIFISLGLIHQTILEKGLKFKTLTKIRLVSVVISVLGGIIMAIMGLRYWALIYMTLLESLLFTIIVWILNKWFPSFSFNKQVFKELFKDSIRVFSSGILASLSENIITAVIGKFFSTIDVGYYTQGKKLQKRIFDYLSTSFQSVLYPVQSLMKDDLPRLKNAVRRNVSFTTLISFPVLIGLFVVAEPFVLITLTDKWSSSIYYIQILSIAGVLGIIKRPINSYIMVLGKFNLALKFSVLRNLILMSLIFVGIIARLDLRILILSIVFTELIAFSWIFYFAKRIINYNVREISKDVFLPLLFSTLMGIFVYFIGKKLNLSILSLILQVVSGGILYFILNLFFNADIFIEVKSVLFKKGVKNK